MHTSGSKKKKKKTPTWLERRPPRMKTAIRRLTERFSGGGIRLGALMVGRVNTKGHDRMDEVKKEKKNRWRA